MTEYLCDTNVWLAALLRHHVHQPPARTWFEGLDAADRVLFCRSTQQSLLRLLTTNSVLEPYGRPALSSTQAWDTFEALVADGRVGLVLQEPPGLDTLWRRFSLRPSGSPKLWMDAYLAAFAVAAGLRFVTTDTAFRQFPGLDLLVLDSPAAP